MSRALPAVAYTPSCIETPVKTASVCNARNILLSLTYVPGPAVDVHLMPKAGQRRAYNISAEKKHRWHASRFEEASTGWLAGWAVLVTPPVQ